MLTRIRGFFLIGNFLLPILGLLYLAVLYLSYKGDVEEAWATRVKPQLQAIEQSADTTITLVDNAVTQSASKLQTAADGLADLGATLAGAADTVKEPLNTLGAITVPRYSVQFEHQDPLCPNKKRFGKQIKPCIPKIDNRPFAMGATLTKPFVDAYNAMAAAAQPFKDIKLALADLGVLSQVPEEAQKVQASLAIVSASVISLSEPVGNVLSTLGNFAIFLLVWFGVQRLLRSGQELLQGWQMLTLGDRYQQPS